jgi:hypothetical protein
MSQAEKEFVKWFIDRFSRMPVDTDADNGMKEAFCNAYNLGVKHTESSYQESVRRW